MSIKSLLFTKEALHKIETPKEKRDVYIDTREAGLILVISYGGSKTFYLRKAVGKKYHIIKIGIFPDLSVTEAREKAVELKNKIALGINPMEEKAKSSNELTFKELYDKYVNEYSKLNNKGWESYVASMNRYAKHLYSMKISTIQKADIQKLFNDLSKTGKYGANRFMEILSPVFNKAIEWELLKVNPVSGIKKHKKRSRDRYLTGEEVPRFFAELAKEKNQEMKDFFLISLYTAARKSNVLAMRWENVNFTDKIWYIPDTKSKNGKSHRVTLSDQAIEILEARRQKSDSEWVFPSEESKAGHLAEPKRAWHRICKKAKIEDLRIHDIRKIIPSWMAMIGANQYVISQVLNHDDPRSTAIYTRLGLNTVREFMQKTINQILIVAEKRELGAKYS